tara:strand:- start:111 stop:1568 length:1458 start_codon:yes stop_codon:yes gene_type:complete
MSIEFNGNKPPVNYEDWINLGKIIVPCLKGKPIAKDWQKPDFKITKEEWKNKYLHCAMGLRLDQNIDFDIDNDLTKRFIDKYVKSNGAIYGRPTNPRSHYWWKGQLPKKQFVLPKELEKYYKKFPHGATLCEIRSTSSQYTIVPESKHSKADEYVKWEKYEGINEYTGNLNTDLRKVALSTALCILYASQGQRDNYCAAVAGTLLKHTKWSESEIDEFIYNLALESDDNEAEDRARKGTSGKKANRNLGMPKLAEIIGCSTRTVAELFNWVGIEYAASGEIAQEAVGDIIEYGHDRYIVKINAFVDGLLKEKEIRVDGPTLMNQKTFYDAIIIQASVWIPKMKPTDFETIMRKKYENRTQSENYDEDSNEDLVFIKYFSQYIKNQSAFTDKINLLQYKRPHFDITKKSLEFNLGAFEDFLVEKRVNYKRVDLVMNIQKILKAKKYRGKVKNKSCVSWRIENYDLAKEDLVIDGEYEETEKVTDGS